ncbi:nuclear transport factor 2 family protein [Streptomyces sp. MS19]|uniref:nuclear transport factor 2 family protein n=1 Tax=Streptomyces sp. MS19 TaxID=3385972 RepID=UPI00399F6086
MTNHMTNYSGIAETYLSLWNATDPAARLALLEKSWAPQGRYTDPLADAAGPEAISATIGAVQEQFPGLVFTLVGEVDGHHAQARFRWGLGPAGEEPLVIGFDVVTLDGDGRLVDVLGFLDKVPA